jgi:hypothetical protein
MFTVLSLEEMYKAAKSVITDADVRAYLPFNTVVKSGDSLNHIVNDSVFATETKHHTIGRGDTICKRAGRLRSENPLVGMCPGCVEKARVLGAAELVKRYVEENGIAVIEL